MRHPTQPYMKAGDVWRWTRSGAYCMSNVTFQPLLGSSQGCRRGAQQEHSCGSPPRVSAESRCTSGHLIISAARRDKDGQCPFHQRLGSMSGNVRAENRRRCVPSQTNGHVYELQNVVYFLFFYAPTLWVSLKSRLSGG